MLCSVSATAFSITGIDHPIIKAGDVAALDRLQDFMAALGFTYAKRLDAGGYYSDRLVFQDNYLALIGMKPHAALDRWQGPHHGDAESGISKIHLVTWDAAGTALAMAHRGVPATLRHFAIALDLDDGRGPIDTHHRIVEFDSLALPHLRLTACHHLMPDLLFRPEWTAHRNGVRRISGLCGSVSDLTALHDHYHAAFGDGVCRAEDGCLVLTFGADTIAFEQRPQEVEGPRITAIRFEVEDVERIGGLAAAAGAEVSPTGASLRIRHDAVPNTLLEFGPRDAQR